MGSRPVPGRHRPEGGSEHWVCERCSEPLAGQGLIRVFNANPILGPVGSHPIEPTPDGPTEDGESSTLRTPDMRATVSRYAAWAGRRPLNVDFGCFHVMCDPYRDLGSYIISGDVSAEGWIGWVLQLEGKRWMGRADLARMLEYYWQHKGEVPPV